MLCRLNTISSATEPTAPRHKDETKAARAALLALAWWNDPPAGLGNAAAVAPACSGWLSMDEFLALSLLLTGLEPLRTVDATSVENRMARDYQRLMKEQFSAGFEGLLAIYRSVKDGPEPLSALLADARFTGDVEHAARQVVNLWLLSQYGSPGKLPDQDGGFFEKGFVWPAIGAHPIGFSHQNYGYWATKPDVKQEGLR